MTKQLIFNRTDTAISGVSSLALPLAVLNLPVDFVVKSRNAKDVTLSNITSPLGAVETIRFAVNDVANVYTGSSIQPTLWATSKHGVSVLAQINEIFSITDTVDATFRQDLPMSAHIVLKVPDSEFMTGDLLKAIVGRLADTLFNAGVVTSERLAALTRGSLLPQDVG